MEILNPDQTLANLWYYRDLEFIKGSVVIQAHSNHRGQLVIDETELLIYYFYNSLL